MAYHAQLFNWRKRNDIVQKGRTMHFISRDNTYCYFRYTDKSCIMVFINASEENREVPVSHYKEMLDKYGYKGVDVLDGSMVELREGLTIDGLSSMVIELKK